MKMVGLAQDMSMTACVNVLLVTLASPVNKKVFFIIHMEYGSIKLNLEELHAFQHYATPLLSI